jgi:TM2 domain-containing membrane protein YozV
MDQQYSTYSAQKTLLLTIFTGVIGLHRFYLKKYITGTLYFFTIGFVGIGVIIDIIKLLTGNFKDDSNKIIKFK